MALGSPQPLTEMSARSIPGSKGGRCLQPYHHPVPLSWNLGTLTSWNPLGHFRPVTGLIYLFTNVHLGNDENVSCYYTSIHGRLRLKRDGTRAETRFHLSAKRTSPFKLARASVQSTTGSRGVRISGSNAGYTVFRGSVKGTVRIT